MSPGGFLCLEPLFCFGSGAGQIGVLGTCLARKLTARNPELSDQLEQGVVV